MNPIYHGTVVKGKVSLDNPSYFNKNLEKFEGKRIDVIVREYKSQRSNNQNNYYFGVVCQILGDYFGYTPEEMHDALKMKFLRKGAADLETVTSTTKLNTAQFEDYLENVRRWALLEYQITVPLPNEFEAA